MLALARALLLSAAALGLASAQTCSSALPPPASAPLSCYVGSKAPGMPYQPTLRSNSTWVMCFSMNDNGVGVPPGSRAYQGLGMSELDWANAVINGAFPDYSNPLACSTDTCNNPSTTAARCSPVPSPSTAPLPSPAASPSARPSPGGPCTTSLPAEAVGGLTCWVGYATAGAQLPPQPETNSSWVYCIAVSVEGQLPGRAYQGVTTADRPTLEAFAQGAVPGYTELVVCSTSGCNSPATSASCYAPVPSARPTPAGCCGAGCSASSTAGLALAGTRCWDGRGDGPPTPVALPVAGVCGSYLQTCAIIDILRSDSPCYGYPLGAATRVYCPLPISPGISNLGEFLGNPDVAAAISPVQPTLRLCNSELCASPSLDMLECGYAESGTPTPGPAPSRGPPATCCGAACATSDMTPAPGGAMCASGISAPGQQLSLAPLWRGGGWCASYNRTCADADVSDDMSPCLGVEPGRVYRIWYPLAAPEGVTTLRAMLSLMGIAPDALPDATHACNRDRCAAGAEEYACGMGLSPSATGVPGAPSPSATGAPMTPSGSATPAGSGGSPVPTLSPGSSTAATASPSGASASATATPSGSSASSATPSGSSASTASPSGSSAPTSTPSGSPLPSLSPSGSPAPPSTSSTPSGTASGSAAATAAPSATSSSTGTPATTGTPSRTPTGSPSRTASATPSSAPTATGTPTIGGGQSLVGAAPPLSPGSSAGVAVGVIAVLFAAVSAFFVSRRSRRVSGLLSRSAGASSSGAKATPPFPERRGGLSDVRLPVAAPQPAAPAVRQGRDNPLALARQPSVRQSFAPIPRSRE